MTDLNIKTINKSDEKPVVIRNTTDLQRLKLEKLMKNPDKPVVIPERPKGRSMPTVPDFVRNVMGSSAGAGSGEFHVYRHLRRKEYARQKFIQEKSEKEKLNDAYHQKLEDNRKLANDKTAKKRAKRLKRKIKAKENAKKPKIEQKSSESSEEETSEKSDNETTETVEDKCTKIESDSDELKNKTENVPVQETCDEDKSEEQEKCEEDKSEEQEKCDKDKSEEQEKSNEISQNE